MQTKGEIEVAVCDGFRQFEMDFKGRGPRDIQANLIGDFLVIRIIGVLTTAEQHLVKAIPVEKGRDLLKSVRTNLIETARPVLDAMIEKATGVKPVSLHHDISTVSGEEIIIFTLASAPVARGKRDDRRQRQPSLPDFRSRS